MNRSNSAYPVSRLSSTIDLFNNRSQSVSRKKRFFESRSSLNNQTLGGTTALIGTNYKSKAIKLSKAMEEVQNHSHKKEMLKIKVEKLKRMMSDVSSESLDIQKNKLKLGQQALTLKYKTSNLSKSTANYGDEIKRTENSIKKVDKDTSLRRHELEHIY